MPSHKRTSSRLLLIFRIAFSGNPICHLRRDCFHQPTWLHVLSWHGLRLAMQGSYGHVSSVFHRVVDADLVRNAVIASARSDSISRAQLRAPVDGNRLSTARLIYPRIQNPSRQ